MRQTTFPFYNDMQIIFNARMERMLWQEVDGGGTGTGAAISPPAAPTQMPAANPSPVVSGLMSEVLGDYIRQQMEMELQWMKLYEEREEKRGRMEMEWRQRMEVMESERLMLMRWWKERDEERKVREEARADRRDALVAALLTKIKDDGL